MNSQKSSDRDPKAAVRPADAPDRWLVLGICCLLVLVTWIVFGQTLRYDFVTYDDNKYIYENPVVQQGLTWAGLRWALTYGEIGHWHPLTWLTHMLDCQVYGLKPGGHHLTNVLLHTATVVLLFLVLRALTGFLWRSAFVAAVFAIHPLRVESVAWISERKDVLSGLFFMLALAAYVRYARHPFSLPRYGVVVICLTLGLLSKNMLVTTPFVLLLLDYWPLRRFAGASPQVRRALVLEKIPLLGLSILSVVATALVPEKLPPGEHIPFVLRLENAVESYFIYVGQMFHPVNLSCLYIYPATPPPLWQPLLWLALGLAITFGVYTLRKTRPWLAVGWFWYLGMLFPAIGFVQISYYAHADRYTYLPQIGVYLALTWLAAEGCPSWKNRRALLGGGGAVIIAALLVCARAQTAYWRNGESLWRHAADCAPDNFVAHYGLGVSLLPQGRVDEAIPEFRRALQLKPDYIQAQFNLANALFERDDLAGAIVYYQQSLQAPGGQAALDDAMAHNPQRKAEIMQTYNNLGLAFVRQNNLDQALAAFQRAVKLAPDEVVPRNNLGYALLLEGRVDEATAQLRDVLRRQPNYASAHHNLAEALIKKGEMIEAIREYERNLQLDPGSLMALNDLAWELATNPQASARNGSQAVTLAERANQISGGTDPVIATTLAAAYAEAGRFKDARISARAAIHLVQIAGQTNQISQLNDEMKCYEGGRAFHRVRN